MSKGGSFDFRQIEKLQKQLKQMQKENEKFCEECAKYLAARLLRRLVKRTPVGHPPKLDETKTVKVKGASGKSKTFLSRNGAILKQYWAGYTGGTLKRGWTVGEIHKNGNYYEIEIFNPVPYSSYVEYGHRQQPGRYVPAIGKKLKKGWSPGAFMMTISEREIQAQAPAMLERKIAEYLRGHLDV